MKAAKKLAPATPADAEKQLNSFIDKFEPKNQYLDSSGAQGTTEAAANRERTGLRQLQFLRYRLWSNRTPHRLHSFDRGRRLTGVGLCFIRGASLPDPQKILLGSGKQTRFLRIESADVLARPEVEALIAAALAKSKVSPPPIDQKKINYPISFGKAKASP